LIYFVKSQNRFNFITKNRKIMSEPDGKKSRPGGKKTAFVGRATQILIRIADSGGSLTTNDLAEMLKIKANNVSAYLSALREEGFIKTKQGVNKKTLHFHSLTPKGREHLDGMR
jgi:DNA-binding MarR family transcriptional regulator